MGALGMAPRAARAGRCGAAAAPRAAVVGPVAVGGAILRAVHPWRASRRVDGSEGMAAGLAASRGWLCRRVGGRTAQPGSHGRAPVRGSRTRWENRGRGHVASGSGGGLRPFDTAAGDPTAGAGFGRIPPAHGSRWRRGCSRPRRHRAGRLAGPRHRRGCDASQGDSLRAAGASVRTVGWSPAAVARRLRRLSSGRRSSRGSAWAQVMPAMAA